jgi:uncharacterized OsmC-like protein
MSTTELNGLSLTKLQELVGAATKDPESAAPLNKWNARVKWKGGFKSEAYVREHSFRSDEPSTLTGANTAPNAVEYVLSALGGCYVVGFVLNATKRGVKVDDLEVVVEGQLDNILTFFGLSDKGHPGFREIKVKLYARTKADKKTVDEIWKETVATSPVGNTLSRNVTVVPEISVTR